MPSTKSELAEALADLGPLRSGESVCGSIPAQRDAVTLACDTLRDRGLMTSHDTCHTVT